MNEMQSSTAVCVLSKNKSPIGHLKGPTHFTNRNYIDLESEWLSH